MCPAIHINSRSWLRSSSTHEPSDPPLRVVFPTRAERVLFSVPRRPRNERAGGPRRPDGRGDCFTHVRIHDV